MRHIYCRSRNDYCKHLGIYLIEVTGIIFHNESRTRMLAISLMRARLKKQQLPFHFPCSIPFDSALLGYLISAKPETLNPNLRFTVHSSIEQSVQVLAATLPPSFQGFSLQVIL